MPIQILRRRLKRGVAKLGLHLVDADALVYGVYTATVPEHV